MSDLFKHAPEGAIELRELFNGSHLRWFNKDGDAWDGVKWFTSSYKHKTITTRPQQKTVADAYACTNGEWPIDECEELYFSRLNKKYMRRIEVLPNHDAYFVCTYEQFEAYAKEQEAKQEGEKWTHTLDGVRCRVLIEEPDVDGEVVILLENGRYSCSDPVAGLKPIKPKLTKAEAWDKLKDLPANEWSIHSHVMDIENKYDII